jgi:hypothetical protein
MALLDLEADRPPKLCAKHGCKNVFVEGAQSREYCSEKCRNAAGLRRFRRRRRKKKKKEKKIEPHPWVPAGRREDGATRA